ncbi:MAG: lysophospholipid acyltransferase family protein [Thermodesulfobacteriota bacterium]
MPIPPLRLWPRVAVTVLVTLGATLIQGPVMIIVGMLGYRGLFNWKVSRVWAWAISKGLGMSVTLNGAEHFEKGRSYILVPNHQSNADIIALLESIPVPFHWVVKESLLKIPLFGPSVAASGAISVNRSDSRQAVEQLRKGSNKLRDGWSILIYPEGTRTADGNLQPFKKGAFRMAISTGIPLLPITVNGAFKILPKHTLNVRGGHVTITVSAPIQTEGLTEDALPELMEKTRQAILTHFDPDFDPFGKNCA